MKPSKIQLKVQHKNHEKQTKQSKEESIQKQKSQKKEQKSGARLGKSKSKEKLQQKSVAQQSSLKDQKIKKSKSKDKNESKLKEKSSEKKDSKEDKKKDKDQKEKAKQKKNKKVQKGDKQQEGKKSKTYKKKDKQAKQDKKVKKDKKGKKVKNSKKSKKGRSDSQQGDSQSLARSRSNRSLDKQLQTISNINKQTAKAKLTIGELIDLYKDASYDIFVNHGHNPQKQKQIEQDLLRLQKEKEKRHKRLEELDKAAEEKRRLKEIQVQQKQKKKKQAIMEKRKRAISLRLQSLASQAKRRKQQHQRFEQYASQRKHQQPRYKKYQQPFIQLTHAIQHQHQQILHQRKLNIAPTDYQQLQHFRESYQQQKLQALQHAERKMELQQRIIEQENQWMGKLYKGSVYVDVEREGRRNGVVEEYRTAKEKLQRTKEYGQMVKSLFVSGNNNKDEQEQAEQGSRIDYDSQDVRYRQKHLLGKSLGLVPEKRIKPLTHEQKLKMGVSYLQQLRRLPRKGLKSTDDKNTPILQTPMKSSRIGGTYIMKKPTNPFYTLQRSGTSFDEKNKRQIELTMEQVKSKDQSTALQQKALKYMQYAGVNQLQKRHSDVNKRLVGDISSKLDILKKLVE